MQIAMFETDITHPNCQPKGVRTLFCARTLFPQRLDRLHSEKSSDPFWHAHIRSGVTLVELLVVVAILSIVTASAIPLMAPAVETRRLREASRGLSTFLAGARARAIERDRPVGVELVPLDGEPGAALEAFYVEVPPMYSGDTTGSTAEFTTINTGNRSASGTVQLNGAASAASLVRQGDQIRFNYQGPWWTITGPGGGTINVFLQGRDNVPWIADPPANRQRVAFQIRRQPTRSSAAPLQMPGNAAVDLVFSGTDLNNFSGGATIMFAPEGHVTGVVRKLAAHGHTTALSGAIYLLIGGREKIPPPTNADGTPDSQNWNEENCNLFDLKNQWVAIGVQNGQAIAGPMTYMDPAAAATKTPEELLAEARRLASDMRGQGGN